MEEMTAAMEAYVIAKPMVGMWMNWMGIVMLASVLFAWWHKPARWVLLSIPAVMVIALGVFSQTSNLDLMGIAHIIVWPPLMWYLWKEEFSKKNFKVNSLYNLWLVLLVATFLISLAFDVRDAIMILMGME